MFMFYIFTTDASTILVYDVISGKINNMTATEEEVISLIGALAVKLTSPQKEIKWQNRKRKVQLLLSWTAQPGVIRPMVLSQCWKGSDCSAPKSNFRSSECF